MAEQEHDPVARQQNSTRDQQDPSRARSRANRLFRILSRDFTHGTLTLSTMPSDCLPMTLIHRSISTLTVWRSAPTSDTGLGRARYPRHIRTDYDSDAVPLLSTDPHFRTTAQNDFFSIAPFSCSPLLEHYFSLNIALIPSVLRFEHCKFGLKLAFSWAMGISLKRLPCRIHNTHQQAVSRLISIKPASTTPVALVKLSVGSMGGPKISMCAYKVGSFRSASYD